jgi:hypothetical protein
MTPEEVFHRWRDAAGPWAQWIKPSLMTQIPPGVEPRAPRPMSLEGIPAEDRTALILDLPGVEAVELGVALMARGYCPVVLFNTTHEEDAVVKTWDLMATLSGAASHLEARSKGPPVFLLDARRQSVVGEMSGGRFDNRWYVFGSDFPTEEGFISRGIRRMAIVCRQEVQPDLQDALAHHRGLEPVVLSPGSATPEPLPRNRSGLVRGLSNLGRMLHRRSDGSFGYRIAHG